MMSTRLSFNPFRYMAFQIRENLWLTFVLGLLYVLICPVVMYLMVSSRLANEYAGGNMEQMALLHEQLAQSIHMDSWSILYPAAMASGVMLAMVLGGYLKSKREVNFYHSLPVKRSQWMLTQIGTGFAIHTIVMVVTLLLFIVVAHVLVPGSLIRDGLLVLHFLQVEMFFLVSFLLTMLAGQLTGNFLAQLAMSLVLQLWVLVTAATLMAVFASQFSTFAGIPWLTGMTHWSLPSLFVHYAGDMNTSYMHGLAPKQWAGLLAVGVAAFAAAMALYRRFPSERVSDTLIYERAALPLKLFFLFCGPLLVGTMFSESAGNRLIAFLLGFIISGVLIHVVIEMAFNKSVRTLHKHLPSTLIILVLAFLFFMGCRTDITGFNRYVPQPEAIKEVSVSALYFEFDKSGYPIPADANAMISNDETIRLVHQLAQTLVENHVDRVTPSFDNNQLYGYAGTVPFQNIGLTYRLDNGKTVNRTYTVPQDAIKDEARALYNDAVYKQFIWQPIFDASLDQIKTLSLTPRSFGSDDMGRWGVVLYGEGATVSKENGNRLLAALKQDLSDRRFEDLNSDALAQVEVVMANPQNPNVAYPMYLFVYPSDTHVVAVMEDLRRDGDLKTDDDVFTEDMITEVGLMRRKPIAEGVEYEPVMVTTDLVTMKEWLYNRSVGRNRTTEIGVTYDTDFVFSIRKADGTEVLRNILAGHVPEVANHGE